MVKLKKRVDELTQTNKQSNIDNDDIASDNAKLSSEDYPEFNEILLRAKQDLEDLRKDPHKWVKEAEKSFKNICNGTANLGNYSELDAKLKSMGI